MFAKRCAVAADLERAGIGLELADQGPHQLELAAAHEAVDAERLALAHREVDTLEGTPVAQPLDLQPHRRAHRRRQLEPVQIALLELGVIAADHQLDDLCLVELGRRCRAHMPAVPEDRDVVGDRRDVVEEVRDEDEALALGPQPVDDLEELRHLGRRQRRGRLVEDDDPGTREQHAADLDQLLQAQGQAAGQGRRIDLDAEPGQMLARHLRHVPPAHRAEAVGRLAAEEHVLGDGQIGNDRQLLVHHADAGSERVAGRAELHRRAVDLVACRHSRCARRR